MEGFWLEGPRTQLRKAGGGELHVQKLPSWTYIQSGWDNGIFTSNLRLLMIETEAAPLSQHEADLSFK